jgi:glucose-1-phosphate cytidylyltransferase
MAPKLDDEAMLALWRSLMAANFPRSPLIDRRDTVLQKCSGSLGEEKGGYRVKVAILAGGFGTRFAEETAYRPKPMIEIGGRPILWHIMMHYYAFGHTDFVLALGYKSDVIKRWFKDMAELEGDMRIQPHLGRVERFAKNAPDWTVDLIDSGLEANTGGRIKSLADTIGRERFMLTWGDGVSDVNLDALLSFHRSHGKLATMTAVLPPARFGQLALDGAKVVSFQEKPRASEGWINGAFFVLEPEVFDYIDGPETQFEKAPLERLARDGQLMAYQHAGFWQCMDSLSDKLKLEQMWESGRAPWVTWDKVSCKFSSPATAAM